MNTRLIFDGIDCSRFIERRATPVITAETHDEEGNQTMGELQLALSNMDGEFSGYLSAVDPVPLEIYIGKDRLMRGSTTPEGISSDDDQEIVYVSALPQEHEIIDKMKAKKCRELAELAAGRWRVFNIIAGDLNPASVPNYSEGRRFLGLDEILKVFNESGFPVACDVAGVDLTEFYIGGVTIHSEPELPDITWWELFRAIASIWNATIWMDEDTLKFTDKAAMLAQSLAPLKLPLLRDSFRETNIRVGYDSLEISYQNANDRSVWSGATVGMHTALRPGVTDPVRVLPAKIELKIPNIATREFFEINTAYIERAVSESGYLVHNPQASKTQHPSDYSLGEYYPEFSFAYPASLIAKRYECELAGLTEWEAEYSVMDNPGVLLDLIKPLRPIQHPSGPGARSLIRSVRIDTDNETARVNAMRYA